MVTLIVDPHAPRQVLIDEGLLQNVHLESSCRGRACTIHRPTNHHMRNWPLHWRQDRVLFERICSHGIGHYDPDQEEFWRETGQEAQMVHGCDGCCRSRTEED